MQLREHCVLVEVVVAVAEAAAAEYEGNISNLEHKSEAITIDAPSLSSCFNTLTNLCLSQLRRLPHSRQFNTYGLGHMYGGRHSAVQYLAN